MWEPARASVPSEEHTAHVVQTDRAAASTLRGHVCMARVSREGGQDEVKAQLSMAGSHAL